MGWSIGFDEHWNRDIGYGVVAYCDHPECEEVIDRGLSYVCGGEPYGGDLGCGLYFCGKHTKYQNFDFEGLPTEMDTDRSAMVCERCQDDSSVPFEPAPEHPYWLAWKLIHSSWQKWRDENFEEIERIKNILLSIPKGVMENLEEEQNE